MQVKEAIQDDSENDEREISEKITADEKQDEKWSNEPCKWEEVDLEADENLFGNLSEGGSDNL